MCVLHNRTKNWIMIGYTSKQNTFLRNLAFVVELLIVSVKGSYRVKKELFFTELFIKALI